MITNLQIDNFKSLKGINVKFGDLNFIVGPNASGKTNLAEALDFLSHAIREDLAYAVSEKGGFYNICHRRQRRARGAISFSISCSFRVATNVDCNFTLQFQIKTKGEDIRADFFVSSESLLIQYVSAGFKRGATSLFVWREKDEYKSEFSQEVVGNSLQHPAITRFAQRCKNVPNILESFDEVSPQSLILSGYLREFWPLSMIAKELRGLRVFQFNPRLARQPAAPSVHGDLGRRGENLASALDRVRLHEGNTFKTLTQWLKDVVPTLGRLMTDYTDSRQLGLFFEEDGFAARWFAEDVSDGTIMSVALFFSLLDRRHRIVMIEEPETSLHPWILRKFLERCRELSVKRQIIITTHSPLAVAFAKPSELFLIDRKEGATSLTRAEDLEANLSEIIRADLINLGEYWLSGGLGAVPTVPDVGDDELFG
jgi:predicted ATPase